MIKEWESSSEYNSFNSWKGLMYVEHYRAILEGKFLPPIEASVDPANRCNLKCRWCNGFDVYNRNILMDSGHLLDLVRFFKDWGVKGVCFAGGGEPTLHPALDKAIDLCYALKLPVAVISNGTFTNNDSLINSLAAYSRWVGISIDAATAETYKRLKGVDRLNDVFNTIRKLEKKGAREVTFKFLLHPDNQHEVFDAVMIARDLGCHRIHIRPVSFRNFQEVEDNYNIDLINEQVMRGRGMFESERFKVFYIQHKYNNDLHRKFNFKKCLATPIMPIFQANGDISICIDRKADTSLVIGSHLDISKIKDIWGGDKHKQVIDSVKLNECPKCTLNRYNEQIEYAVINNGMDYEFT